MTMTCSRDDSKVRGDMDLLRSSLEQVRADWQDLHADLLRWLDSTVRICKMRNASECWSAATHGRKCHNGTLDA